MDHLWCPSSPKAQPSCIQLQPLPDLVRAPGKYDDPMPFRVHNINLVALGKCLS